MSAMLLGAFVAHRALSRLPALRRLTPDWESWQRRDDFPMGLALSGTLLAYLALPLLFAR
jgi:prepilin peptidase CpaA